MSDADWELFNAALASLLEKLHEQGERVEDLESRCTTLGRRLREYEPESTRPVLRVVEPREAEGAHV